MSLKKLAFSGLLILASVASCGVLVAETYAVPCPNGSLRYGEDLSSYAECNLPNPDNEKSLMQTVSQILNVVVGVVGVVAVAAIIVGAIYFVTSQGDAAKVTRARNTILYGVVGLIVALLAFAIVNFVLSSVFSGTASTASSDGSSAANP